MSTTRPFIAVLFVFLAAAAAAPARGADFRVENAVYIGTEAKPQSRGTTIFHAGLVYDFLDDQSEIMVFDKPHGRFVLLDLERRVQTELSTDEVRAFIDQAKKNLAKPTNPPLMRWLADPIFDTTYDSPTSELRLRGEPMTYEVVLLPTGPELAAQYHEFNDWDAQFNHVLNPESRPPFARMMLDAAMERNHGIAKEVRLTTSFAKWAAPNSGKPATTTKITSRHELAGQLGASDMKRIAEAREDMKSFQHVALKDYVQKK
jgi:hypothetical protein